MGTYGGPMGDLWGIYGDLWGIYHMPQSVTVGKCLLMVLRRFIYGDLWGSCGCGLGLMGVIYGAISPGYGAVLYLWHCGV